MADPPDQLPADVLCRTVGGSVNVGPLLTTWTDEITVPEFVPSPRYTSGFQSSTSIGNNFMVDAFDQLPTTIAPNIGDPHPAYPSTFCANVRLDPLSGSNGPSPVGITLLVDWMQATTVQSTAGSSQIFPRHQLTVTPYQIQEVRNFDKNGRSTGVVYMNPAAIPIPAPLVFPWRIASVRVMRTMQNIRITQYEDVSGESAYDLMGTDLNEIDAIGVKVPFYNNDSWYGFPPFTLLYLGTSTDDGALPLARTTYDFLYNERGWNKFINVYTSADGYVPPGVDNLPLAFTASGTPSPPNVGSDPTLPTSLHGNTLAGKTYNGIGVFDMYDDVAFADAFDTIFIPPEVGP